MGRPFQKKKKKSMGRLAAQRRMTMKESACDKEKLKLQKWFTS